MQELKEKIITHKTALLAQSKGFPEFTTGDYYNADGILNGDVTPYIKAKIQYLQNKRKGIIEDAPESGTITAVTQSLLQKWLREVHKLFIGIPLRDDDGFNVYVKGINDKRYYFSTDNSYDTYELALEEGLIQALNLIENGK